MGAVAERSILEAVKQVVESTLKIPSEKLDVEADFESFGMDSIIAMELMTNLSKQFSISITPAQFTNVNTVKELAEHIASTVGDKQTVTAPAETVKAEVTREREPSHSADRTALSRSLSALQRKAPIGRKVVDNASLSTALQFVYDTYGIDLRQRRFADVDALADELMSQHLDTLLQHYAAALRVDGGVEDDSNALFSHIATRTPQTLDVAIVGMSCRFADAPDHHQFWQNLCEGKVSIREIPASRWDWREHYAESTQPGKTRSKWGALIEDVDCFDHEFFGIGAAEARFIDPQERLALQEVYRALQDAGLDVSRLAGSKTGVFLGYEYSEYEQYLRRNAARIADVPRLSSSSPSYYLANRVSFMLDLCGPSESININCASSAVAIHRAYYSLLNSESDVAVAGGVSLNLFADDYIAVSHYGMLSPTGRCAVFDDKADGFTRGEGVAALVLKRLDDAERDGDRIYAVIKSSQENNRGRASFISEIKHEAITDVIKQCYTKAGVSADTLAYIEVDGYATKWGDSFEFEGIKNAFTGQPAGGKSSAVKHCALGSVKGNIGHLEPVSGAASVMKVALALYHKTFPATVSVNEVSKFIDIDNAAHPLYIADKKIPFASVSRDMSLPMRAGINSFADSGANVHILLEEYRGESRAVAQSGKQLLVFSAKNRERLRELVQQHAAFLRDANSDLTSLAYTLQVGREALEERLAIVADSVGALLEKLQWLLQQGEDAAWHDESRHIFQANTRQNTDSSILRLLNSEASAAQVSASARAGHWGDIAQLWIRGVAVDWRPLWAGRGVAPLSLPGYPFARQRCWAELAGEGKIADTPKTANTIAEGKDTLPTKALPVKESSASSTSEAQTSDLLADESGFEWYFARDAEALATSEISDAKEKMSCFLVQEVARQLKRPRDAISTGENFLALGYDSVALAELMYKVIQLLDISLSPSVVFRHPDIDSFSAYIAEHHAAAMQQIGVCRKKSEAATTGSAPTSAAVSLPAGEEGAADAFPLSFAQERLYFLQELTNAAGEHAESYNVPLAVRLPLALDEAILRAALTLVAERQPSLRTRFASEGDGLCQQVLPDVEHISLNVADLSALAGEDARLQQARDLCLAESRRPFALNEGPCWRVLLIRLPGEDSILMLNMHHVIADGWSMGILLQDLASALESLDTGSAPAWKALSMHYGEYARQQREHVQNADADYAYWLQQLQGVPPKLDLGSREATFTPVGDNVVDNNAADNNAVDNNAAESAHRTIAITELQAFKALAAQQGCTLYMALMAIFALVFQRWSGRDDMCVGSVQANRDFTTATMIGCFFDVLPLRLCVSDTQDVAQLLAHLRDTQLAAQEHALPIECILGELKRQQGLQQAPMNILFNQGAPSATTALPFGNRHLHIFDYGQAEKLNLSEMTVFISTDADTLRLDLLYDVERYSQHSMNRLLDDVQRLLQVVTSTPKLSLGQLADEAGVRQRPHLHVVGTYSAEPLAETADLIARRLPLPLRLSFGPYNQVVQTLIDIAPRENQVLLALVALEDCYRYHEHLTLEQKQQAVAEFSELLLAALHGSAANAISLLVHLPQAEKVTDAAERDMLCAAREQLRQATLTLPALAWIDESMIDQQFPISGERYQPSTDREAHAVFSEAYYTAVAAFVLRHYYTLHQRTLRKVIVVDADNTLWAGAVAEEGARGLRITPAHRQLQHQLQQKKAQGYLLALCSKNEMADIASVFATRDEMVLQLEDFISSKINWRHKSENIIEIAAELNLGMDAVVFLDDDPLEIAALRLCCPEVLCLQVPAAAQLARFIGGLWCFDQQQLTLEDQQRHSMMMADSERRQLARELSYEDFLDALVVEVDIHPMADNEIARVSQLSQRTKQFNTHKRPFNEAELRAYAATPQQHILTARVRDRFGDYGLVGVMMVRRQGKTLLLEHWLLSCRALGRRVEVQMLKHLLRDKGLSKFKIIFHETLRNTPAKQLLEQLDAHREGTAFVLQRKQLSAFQPVDYGGAMSAEPVASTATALELDTALVREEERFLQEVVRHFSSVERIRQTLASLATVQPAGASAEARPYRAPRNDIEKRLVSLWAEVLSLPEHSLGIDDDFFARGGHSLLALKLMPKIEQHFARELPLAVLFSAPTVAQLARYISGEAQLSHDVLVPVQTAGDAVPLFAVPGAHGGVVNLQGLSQALGATPFYGLQSVGLNGEVEPLNVLDDIVETNLAALRAQRPQGPYRLLGYSNGGVVAFEMARRLIEAGERDLHLFLIDCLCPLERMNDISEEIVDVCNNLMDSLGSHFRFELAQLREVPESERCDYLYQAMTQHGFDISRRQFDTYYKIMIASEEACRNYTPQALPQPIAVTLYRASEAYPDASEDYGWNALLCAPLRTVDVQADHITVLYNDAVAAIARDILAPSAGKIADET